ncbi:MAG TPA: POTRA domain-containing protein [Terriglobales bacterium]|jgi:outer membrane protein assembly factor BamA|nr:POTRA domain-containing protein [Terriglobales bacterium]
MISFATLRSSLFWACAVLNVGGISAQTSKPAPKELPASAYQLLAIKVTGSERYKPEDIAAATGLQLGQTVHEEDFRAGVRILGDSGAFVDVAFSFDYSAKGTKGEFHVKDSPDFVPARFENFVWFSNRDLAEKLHARVPLFHGELPIRGDLVDQVSLALQAMLIDKTIEGSVDYTRVGAEGGPTQAFDFSVTGPHITIHEVQFPGADPSLLPVLKAAARELSGRDYSRDAIRAMAEKNFLRFYLQRGYLRATLGDPEASVVKSDPEQVTVDVVLRPDPGAQYKLAELSISGNKVISTDTLRKLIPARIGEPINAIEMEDDETALQHLYGSRGYVAVVIKTSRELDDKTLSVKYGLAISEGDVYTMGELDIHGLDSPTTAKMQTAWKLRTGDTYNSDYPQQFAKQADEELRDWNITIHESVNPKDKTVDVTLRFDPRS